MKLSPKEKKRIEEKDINILIGKWRENIIVSSTIKERIDPMLQNQYSQHLDNMIECIKQGLNKNPEMNCEGLKELFREKFGAIILSSGNDPFVLLKRILQAGNVNNKERGRKK